MEDTNQVSCILYDGNHPPRYFKFKRRLIHLFFYGLPLVSFISILLLIGVGVYFKQIQRLSQKRVPEIINLLQKDKSKLENELTLLKKEKEALITKLSTPVENTSSLSLFTETPGRKDFSEQAKLDLNSFKLNTEATGKKLTFNIINQTENQERLSGFIFVILKSPSALYVWPNSTIQENTTIAFNSGESFVTSRFRPVEASFKNLDDNIQSVKVIIFNRTGDILLQRITTEF